jgi:hypothetical protein
MKKFLLLLNLTHLAFGQEIVEFKTGTSFGECLGYCLSELTISANDADYVLYGWDENDPVFRPVAISDTVDSNDWEDLNTQFNFELFMNLDSIIGCPDCADGGAEWFEIVTNDTVERVTIEYGDSLEGLNNYIDLLRSVRHSFQEIQACHYIPNAGICLAAIPKYYYDQEENQCMEFTWGGCGGLVPFETLEDCESNCINDGLELSNDIFQYPAKYNLNNCYPNPFNPITTLRYDLPKDALVNITIYDMMGRIVNNLVSSQQNAGYKSIQWNATNDKGAPVSAGLYLYTIQAGDYSKTKKMVLLK